jgi:hypothetical protein
LEIRQAGWAAAEVCLSGSKEILLWMEVCRRRRVVLNDRCPLLQSVEDRLCAALLGRLQIVLVVPRVALILGSIDSDLRRCAEPLRFVVRGTWHTWILQRVPGLAESAIYLGDRERLQQPEKSGLFVWVLSVQDGHDARCTYAVALFVLIAESALLNVSRANCSTNAWAVTSSWTVSLPIFSALNLSSLSINVVV